MKVHFHRMTTEYSNWLVNKIVDKGADMVAMRKQFLRDNREKHEVNSYDFKRKDKGEKTKENIHLFFGFEHVYFKS